jgi:serine/threonine protein kinase
MQENKTNVYWKTEQFPRALLSNGRVVFKPNSWRKKVNYMVQIKEKKEAQKMTGSFAQVFPATLLEEENKVKKMPRNVALRFPFLSSTAAFKEFEIQFYFSRIAEKQLLENGSTPFFLPLHDAFRFEYRRETVPFPIASTMNYRTYQTYYAAASQWADGGELEDFIKKNPQLPTPDVIHIAFQLAQGLLALRSIGVVHHDIKSSNILVRNNAFANVVDSVPGKNDIEAQKLRHEFEFQFVGSPSSINNITKNVILPAQQTLVYISDFGFAFQVLAKSEEVAVISNVEKKIESGASFRFRSLNEGRNWGTPPHIAPELIVLGFLAKFGVEELRTNEMQALFAADVFSMGVVFAQLFQGRKPWNNNFNRAILNDPTNAVTIKIRKMVEKLQRPGRTFNGQYILRFIKFLNPRRPTNEVGAVTRMILFLSEMVHLFGPLSGEVKQMYVAYVTTHILSSQPSQFSSDSPSSIVSNVENALFYILNETETIASEYGLGVVLQNLNTFRTNANTSGAASSGMNVSGNEKSKNTAEVEDKFRNIIKRMLDLNYKTRIPIEKVYAELLSLVIDPQEKSSPQTIDPLTDTKKFTLRAQRAYFPELFAEQMAVKSAPQPELQLPIATDISLDEGKDSFDGCAYPSCTSSSVEYACTQFAHRRFCSPLCAHAHWQFYGSTHAHW